MVVGNTTTINSLRPAYTAAQAPAANAAAVARVNSAAQNTADLSVPESLRAKYALTGQGVEKNDLAYQEGSMDEIQDRLQRLTELAKRSADGTVTDEERASLQAEAEALQADIDRIAGGGSADCAPAMFSLTAEAPSPKGAAAAPVPEEIETAAPATSAVSHAWQAKTYTAAWSGSIDPGQVKAGSTLSVNGVTFEFTDNAWTGSGGADAIKVDITDATGEEIAKKFTDAVASDAAQKAILEKSGWDGRVAEGETGAVTCSWTKDDASGKWTLKLAQSKKLAQDGDTLSVQADTRSEIKDVAYSQFGGSNVYQGIYSNISTSSVENGFTLRIGEAQVAVKVLASEDDIPAGDKYFQWEDAGKKRGTAYVVKDILFPEGLPRDEGSLAYAVSCALGEDNGYQVRVNKKSEDTLSIQVTGSSKDLPQLKFFSPAPEIKEASNDVADAETPAYLRYEVDLDDLKDGDSFKFRGVRFTFDGNSEAGAASVKKKKDEMVVRIGVGNAQTESKAKAMTSFETKFNTYFAEKKSFVTGPYSGSAASGTATRAGNVQNAFKNVLSMLKAGAFEMKISVDGGKATVTIFSKTRSVLDKAMKIAVEDGEGWNAEEAKNTGEEAEEASAQSDDGQEVQGAVEEQQAMEAQEAAMGRAVEQAEVQTVTPQANAETLTTEALGIDGIDLSTKEGAAEAVKILEEAAGKLSESRAALESGEAAEDEKIKSADEAGGVLEKAVSQIDREPEDSMEAQAAKLENGEVKRLTES